MLKRNFSNSLIPGSPNIGRYVSYSGISACSWARARSDIMFETKSFASFQRIYALYVWLTVAHLDNNSGRSTDISEWIFCSHSEPNDWTTGIFSNLSKPSWSGVKLSIADSNVSQSDFDMLASIAVSAIMPPYGNKSRSMESIGVLPDFKFSICLASILPVGNSTSAAITSGVDSSTKIGFNAPHPPIITCAWR